MARADLLVDLVKYAVTGNKTMIKKVTEAIIAEERNKQHAILADKLENELRKTPLPNDNFQRENILQNTGRSLSFDYRAENLISELTPVKKNC